MMIWVYVKLPWKLATHDASNYTRYAGLSALPREVYSLTECAQNILSVAIYMKRFVFSTISLAS